jgi:xylan 1,4-beta-xylosidase
VSTTPQTYCNPLPLPNYPLGRACREPSRPHGPWLQDGCADFRELADPTVVWHQGRWILYPSCAMAWVSDDFATWYKHPVSPSDVGYAPTVVQHGDRWLLMACRSQVYAAADPLGPFAPLGPMRGPDGRILAALDDPMLFADDDGRLYLYWGLGPPGLFGAEVDPRTCDRLLHEPRLLLTYESGIAWERFGEYNEDISRSYIEGPWMVKVGTTYYLTYAAPGTEWRTYGMGAARGAAPLGPFVRQSRHPFCMRTDGLVQGTGHGSIVRGPGEALWAFYTCRVAYEHIFERRIGCDPCGVDEDGNLFVSPSEVPQWRPGTRPHPAQGNGAGLLPMNHRRRVATSSAAPGRPGCYAVDHAMHTWWQPAISDAAPWCEQDLGIEARLAAVRVVWRDVGLDASAGIHPGPVRWQLETADAAGVWRVTVDAAGNDLDLLIDYREFSPCRAKRIRLRILAWPCDLIPGVIDLTVFGSA